MLKSRYRIPVFLLFIGALVSSMAFVPITTTIRNSPQEPSYVLSDGESWLTGWNYRQRISITNASGTGTNYQVFINILYSSKMQTDFDDLRFTDNDGDTLLDAWLEEKSDSNFAGIWIEVADNLNSTAQSIYMYYGNSTVVDYWDGPATFLLFDDFNDDSFNTTLWNTITGSPSESQGLLELDGNTLAVESNEFFSYGVAMGGFVTFLEMRAFGFGVYSPFDKENYLESTGDRQYCRTDADVAEDPYSFTQDAWQILQVNWYNGSYASGYVNRTLVTEVSSTYVPDADMPLLFYVYDLDNEGLYLDWVYVRKLADSIEPVASIYGEWTQIGIAEFIFPIGWDPVFQFGYDAFFIFLGLIMIPFSTLYLVRGGMKEMSRDKLFLGLIIFVMGFGLLIGGVMP